MSIESLSSLSQEFEVIQKKFIEDALAKFKPALLEVFEKHPSIIKYGWTQYTPYFNDGEPCVFNVGDINYLDEERVKENEEEGDEEEEDSMDSWNWFYGDDKKKYPQLSVIADFLEKNEDICASAFGDGVQVIVSRDGVEVEEYSHD